MGWLDDIRELEVKILREREITMKKYNGNSKAYVDHFRSVKSGTGLYKIECYDGIFRTDCVICKMFNVVGRIIIEDLTFRGADRYGRGTCHVCGVLAYIVRERVGECEIYYRAGEIKCESEETAMVNLHPAEETVNLYTELKALYKKLVLRYHPDKTGDQDSREIFNKIQQYYYDGNYAGLCSLDDGRV